MPIRLNANGISPHLIWIMGLLEMITVPMVVAIPKWTEGMLKHPLHGMAIGFVGILVLLYGLNTILAKLRIRVGGFIITRVTIYSSAIWGSFFLLMLFIFQWILKNVLTLGYPTKEILLGVVATTATMLCFSVIYHIIAKHVIWFSIKFDTNSGSFTITRFSTVALTLFATVYEGIALPIIALWQFVADDQVLVSIATGLAGGLIGAGIVWLLFFLTRKPRMWIELCKL